MNESCPISGQIIDKNKIKASSYLNIIISLLIIYTESYFISLLFLIDLFIKNIDIENSFLCKVSAMIQGLYIKKEPDYMDFAPKSFSLKLALLMIITANIFFFINTEVSILIYTFFIILNIFEGVFDFCVGCWIYSLIQRIKR
jgi:hypothetical protein